MTEILFYHLQNGSLWKRCSPSLVEKSLERGWRAASRVMSEERLQALDDRLWTYSDESFLPHGTDREAHAAEPAGTDDVGRAEPNGASIRFLVEGATSRRMRELRSGSVVLFDGNDQAALCIARDQWQLVKEAGHRLAYWQQDEQRPLEQEGVRGQR